MMKTAVTIFFFALILYGCGPDQKALSRHLRQAQKEGMISSRKMQEIESEFASVPDSLQEKYIKQLSAIIEAGGDSSHIDVVRRRIFKNSR